MTNLKKAKELSLRLAQIETRDGYQKIAVRAKALKAKIEAEGCGKPLWNDKPFGIGCNNSLMLCRDCQAALKEIEEILK